MKWFYSTSGSKPSSSSSPEEPQLLKVERLESVAVNGVQRRLRDVERDKLRQAVVADLKEVDGGGGVDSEIEEEDVAYADLSDVDLDMFEGGEEGQREQEGEGEGGDEKGKEEKKAV